MAISNDTITYYGSDPEDGLSAPVQLRRVVQRVLNRCARLEREAEAAREVLAQLRAELAGAREVTAQARHGTLHDGLTKLPNRQLFRDRLDRALAQQAAAGTPVSVMYLDLDGFKAVNDQHGHDVGDQLLCVVAERLRRAVRAQDVCARLGGDEFACLFVQVPERDQLAALARKLVATVAAPVMLGALRLCIRPSIGIALGPVDACTVSALLACADAAMYRAKRARTGWAFFEGAGALAPVGRPCVARWIRPCRT